jgi:hypothetical protein
VLGVLHNWPRMPETGAVDGGPGTSDGLGASEQRGISERGAVHRSERRDLTGACWQQAAVVLTVGVAAALLAACGARTASAAPRAGQQLRQALRDWSGFAVSASPRPLVLVASRVDDPSSGFPDGVAKLAYIEEPSTCPLGFRLGRLPRPAFP